MTGSIFLSASVPISDRDPEYFKTADVVAIKESIVGLAGAIFPMKQLVFGGHPAITPLISELAAGYDSAKVVVYQSEFFNRELLPELAECSNVKFVPAVKNNREMSLAKMRDTMLRAHEFEAGVFIGGMEGVEEEYRLFRELHSNKPAYPIASTGAAALKLYQNNKSQKPELMTELQYLALFRRLLGLQSK